MSQTGSDSFPLLRDSTGFQRMERTVVAWMLLVPVVVAGTMVLLAIGHAGPIAKTWGAYPLIAALWATGVFIFRLMRRTSGADTLRLDASGIHFTRDGKAFDYPWRDVERAKKILLNPGGRTPLYGMQIQRKGAIYMPDDIFDYVVAGQFGFRDSEFAALVAAGVERWGSPIPTASASPAPC
jgi:hypothetical protein